MSVSASPAPLCSMRSVAAAVASAGWRLSAQRGAGRAALARSSIHDSIPLIKRVAIIRPSVDGAPRLIDARSGLVNDVSLDLRQYTFRASSWTRMASAVNKSLRHAARTGGVPAARRPPQRFEGTAQAGDLY